MESRASVVISEFMASNGSTLTNSLGVAADWIELYNTTTNPVDLSGWFLTDSASNLQKWTFPAGTLIPGNGYRLVFASDHPQSLVGGELHARFRLGDEGEYLGLVHPDGVTVAHAYAPVYPPQTRDVSFGLRPDVSNSVLVAQGEPYRYWIPSGTEGGWTTTTYNDGSWPMGTGPLGCEPTNAPVFGALIQTPVTNTAAGVYRRSTFVVQTPARFDALTLRAKFDDGMSVSLNGTKVLTINAPTDSQWNSLAPLDRDDGDALFDEDYALPGGLPLLVAGTNVLAVHVLNDNNNPRFASMLLDVVLDADSHAAGVGAEWRYFHTPTPGAANRLGDLAAAYPVAVNYERGFYDAPFAVTLTASNGFHEIRYTRDGSVPLTNSALYAGPLWIGTSTVLRVRGFRSGYEPSPVTTHTYLFVADIRTQSVINQSVVTHAEYGPQFEASLKSLPVLSLATEPDNLFNPATGIYANPQQRGILWERPVSLEWIDASGGDEFAVDCGARIYGGYFRAAAKKSFRFLFKSLYGPGKLEFPLFDAPGAVTSFDTFILRAGGNDTFQSNGLIDPFVRGCQLATGQPASRAAFVHLFLNGVYWGLYNPSERCDQAFGASYFDVEKEQWDAINAGFPTGESLTDTYTAMQSAVVTAANGPDNFRKLEGLNPDGTRNPNWPVHLDIDNHIDYMLTHIWAGTGDWPHHNWYAGGARTNSTGWKFFVWDSEWSLSALTANISGTSGPIGIHQRLRANPEYQLRFGDHVRRHLFDGGPFTPGPLLERHQALVARVEPAIVAHAARWGSTGTPTTWRNAQNSIQQSYLPGRTQVVLGQLRAVGLYPAIDAPTFSQYGGLFGDDFQLVISASNAVYYTLDGRDPRTYGTGVPLGALYSSPVPITTSLRVKARARTPGGVWSALTEALFTSEKVLSLRVTEVMADPAPPPIGSPYAASDFEFIEVQNTSPNPINLALVTIEGGITHTFADRVLDPGAHAVVARHAAAFASRYGGGVVPVGLFEGSLNNAGERIVIRASPGGPKLVDLTYGDARHWPVAAQGGGHSLVPLLQSGQSSGVLDYAGNWRASAFRGGSPGAADPTPVRSLLLNEVVAHTDYTNAAFPDYDSNDWLELYNAGTADVTGTNWYLSDSIANLQKWPVPPSCLVTAGAWQVFSEVHDFHQPLSYGFGLNKAGETLLLSYLPGNAQDRIADGVRFKGQENGASWGRFPDGAAGWFSLEPTSNRANAMPQPRVVISEIMYHPVPTLTRPEDNTADEYVEIMNATSNTVSLWTDAGTWRLDGGITYTFAPGLSLLAGEHVLLVPFDPANTGAREAFLHAYGLTNAPSRLFGPFVGKLSNVGERLALEKPQAPDVPGDPVSWVVVDEVVYGSRDPWPENADGDGAALQRIQVLASGMDPSNWSSDFVVSPGSRRVKVGIVSPAQDRVAFAPGVLPVAVSLDDEQLVGEVQAVSLRVDGALIDSVTESPYSFTTVLTAPGTVALQAVVLDGAGAVTSTVTSVRALTVDHAGGAAQLTDVSARLQGRLTGPGEAEIEFFWGRTDGGTDAEDWERSGTIGVRGAGLFIADVSDLLAGETYYYRVRGSSGGQSGWSDAVMFAAQTHDQWSQRLEVTVPGYTRPTILEDFPLLVLLSTNIPGFSYAAFEQSTASDLRVVEPVSGRSLAYELADWNPSGESRLWIRVPMLAGPTDRLHLYWGNTNAVTPPPQSEHGRAWNDRFRAVWHLDTGFLDATANRVTADDGGSSNAPGVTGSARLFSGPPTRVDTRIDGAWYGDNINAQTISLWVKAQSTTAGTVFGVGDGGTTGRLYMRTERGQWGFAADTVNANTVSVQPGIWTLLTLRLDAGSATAMINDGNLHGVGAYTNFTPLAGPYLGAMRLGSEYFQGVVDEVQLSDTVRPPDWSWAHYRNVVQNATFLGYAMRPIDPVDDDGDGIPDAWEREHFGRALAADAEPDLDPDADGVLNRDEYTAGTDPLDGAEYFRMRMNPPGGQDAVVLFETVPAAGDGYAGQRRRYALEHAPTPGGDWEPVGGFTNVLGEGDDVWFEPGSNALPFYRGRVWLEPED